MVGSSEESIFLVRTPNYLVLFPRYAEYQALLGRNNFSNFGFFDLFRILFYYISKSQIWHVFEAIKPPDLLIETKTLDLSGHQDNEP